MAIDERSRHAMYSRLKELMGDEEATVLMEHLPPLGWADVATKRDLDLMRSEFRAELAAALHRQTRAMVGWTLAAMSVLTAATAGIAAGFG